MPGIPSTYWKVARSRDDASPWLVARIEAVRDMFRAEFAHTDTVVICSLSGHLVDESSVEGRTCDRCREYTPNIWRHRYTIRAEGYEMWVEAKFCTACTQGEGYPTPGVDSFGVPLS